MMSVLFAKYKYIALGILFLVYSIGVWRVSGEVVDAGYNRERLHRAEEIIAIKAENDLLLAKVSQAFQQGLTTLQKQQEQHNKEMEDALKDKRYTECAVTDSVRDLYKRKLKTK